MPRRYQKSGKCKNSCYKTVFQWVTVNGRKKKIEHQQNQIPEWLTKARERNVRMGALRSSGPTFKGNGGNSGEFVKPAALSREEHERREKLREDHSKRAPWRYNRGE